MRNESYDVSIKQHTNAEVAVDSMDLMHSSFGTQIIRMHCMQFKCFANMNGTYQQNKNKIHMQSTGEETLN